MRDTETVLNIIRERGKKGLPIEDVYRQLYNPDLYLKAYGKIYKNDGAMTEGVTEETVDAMSRQKIDAIIENIRYERYRWTPVRRTHIPKKNGKTRPLGIPTWSDKLLQEAMRSLLEAYYEPQFSDRSHGFRPGRGCHTALSTIERTWKGTKWFIEGDIKGCFDSIDHQVLLSILRERVRDNRFVRLVGNLLSAGYMEDWKYGNTLSGTPQGGIISPILSNIYLDKLDEFVEKVLIPKYTRGDGRQRNPAYRKIEKRLAKCRRNGEYDEIQELVKQQSRHQRISRTTRNTGGSATSGMQMTLSSDSPGRSRKPSRLGKNRQHSCAMTSNWNFPRRKP
jgi:group II intron reverse transcriptase/maturase